MGLKKKWVAPILKRAAEEGFRTTPVYSNKKTEPYAKGQTYTDPNQYRGAVSIGLIMDRHILVDRDGYKEGTITERELARSLGLSEMPEPFQTNEEGDSKHWIFTIPDDVSLAGVKNSNDGGWQEGIDIKRGNQLCHIKPHKILPNGITADLPIAPSVLIDALRKPVDAKSGEAVKWDGSKAELEETRYYLGYIDPDCGHEDWRNVLMAIHSKYGNSQEAIDLADEWSSEGEKYRGRKEVSQKMSSFSADGGIGYGTLCRMAKEGGAVIVPPQVEADLDLFEDGSKRLEYSTKDRKRTDLGNAERFIDLAEGRLRHVYEKSGVWIQWNGIRWVPTVTPMRFAKAVIRSIDKEASNCTNDEKRINLMKWAIASESKARFDAMLSLAKDDPEILLPVSVMDNKPELIGCKNGVVSLVDKRLIEPDKSLYITRTINADFDPDAKAPIWEKCVLEIMGGDREMASFLQRIAGYALHGGNPEQLMILMLGKGSNGKSLFINTIQYVFGEYGRKIEPNTLTISKFGSGSGGSAREDLVRLHGCRLGVTTETDEGVMLDEGFIKAATGGEKITARGTYERHSIEYTPEYLPFLATNHEPRINGTDEGIWRRICLIPFKENFQGRADTRLPEKLKREAAGIFNWLLDGYSQWHKASNLNIPQKVRKAVSEYRTEQDVLGEWLQDRCITSPSYSVPSKDLYGDYRQWAVDSGIGVLAKQRFTRQLTERGFVTERNKNKRPVTGLKLLHEHPDW